MRIGTWNLDARWSDEHRSLMLDADCDAWLLAEVDERTSLTEYAVHATQSPMAPRRRWVATASRRPMTSSPHPHPASARAQIGATTYVSSVLPWRACGSRPPWVGDRHADKTADLPHRIDGLLSIDHLAVPTGWSTSATRVCSPRATGSGCPTTTPTSPPSRSDARPLSPDRLGPRPFGSNFRDAGVNPVCCRR